MTYRYGFTDFDEAVSAEVRAELARTQAHTVSTIADHLGVRRATLASRINGHTPFRSSELRAVAEMLGTTASTLVARAESGIAMSEVAS